MAYRKISIESRKREAAEKFAHRKDHVQNSPCGSMHFDVHHETDRNGNLEIFVPLLTVPEELEKGIREMVGNDLLQPALLHLTELSILNSMMSRRIVDKFEI